MSFYNLRAAALTYANLERLNIHTEGINEMEEEEFDEPDEALNIDDELATVMKNTENGNDNYTPNPVRSNLILQKFPPDLIEEATKKIKTSQTCVHCQKEGNIINLCICSGCGGRPYHKSCWKDAAFHQADNGCDICQSPTEFAEYVWIQHLLYSNTSSEEQALLHRKDVWSTWFGVPHQQETPRLYIYPRLQLLISEAQALRDDEKELEQFPSLVSFFGDTGGGKSTIIRALIRKAALGDRRLEVPIPGNFIDRHKSTSGDVHLYSDPATIDSKVPIFYADCEGLRGSGLSAATRIHEGYFHPEYTPKSLQSTSGPYTAANMEPRLRRTKPLPLHQENSKDIRDYRQSSTEKQKIQKKGPTTKLNKEALAKEIADHKATVSRRLYLQWAGTLSESVGAGLEHRTIVGPKTRQIIVKDLYPRLLYTYSDVVCYITNNPKATEAELLHLFEWASSGHERTLNQRVRPGLLIVVNKDVPSASDDWLNVDYATETLLSHLELSSAFADLRKTWRKRGKTLRTAEDLILCYYDSFRIIFIPNLEERTTHTIAVQYEKLYTEVQAAIKKMRVKRKSVGMNLNVQSFNKYMEYGFERLARDRTSSIDFHYLETKDAARPRKFHEHMLALMISLKEEEEQHSPDSVADHKALVKNLVPFLANCVASGIRERTVEPEAERMLVDRRLRETRHSLEKFREKAWRCEATSGRHRCRNYWTGHEKGHQFRRRKRSYASRSSDPSSEEESLLVGDFQCTFDKEAVEIAIHQEILRLLKTVNVTDWKAHLAKAALDCGVTEITSNRTCYTCLRRCPIFILPCQDLQHVFCQPCLKRFHHKTGRTDSTLLLAGCPLGCRFKQGIPWHIRVKSPMAGARLLSLDGGGIRGIIELCILNRVVAEVGFGIPIQELFDVAFGTSTGGIIALGLFKKNWTVDKAMEEFERLSEIAFSKRMWMKVRMFRHTAQLLYSYRFKSEGIETALQQAFGQGPLFGYSENSAPDTVKVGVVAGVLGGRRPYLFTNYSRDITGSGTDYLVREENPENEMQIWEAARCTSAAPTYFEPYYNDKTKMEYIDGGLLRNNPVQILEEERRMIWPDARPLDIILSIGTGIQADAQGATKFGGKALSLAKNLVPPGLKGKIAVGLDMIQSTLDCEKQWKDFVSATDIKTRAACHRINVGLEGRPPKIDDVSKLPFLKWEAEKYLHPQRMQYVYSQYSSAHKHVGVVARRLLAALFYFEEDEESAERASIIWTGRIHCRLSSSMTEQFGRLCQSGLEFRKRQYGKDSTRLVKALHTKFDSKSFSSPVEFEAETEEFVIEINMKTRPGWERISGQWVLES